MTLRLLRGARGASLHDCLLAEFRACQQFMQPGSDFFEGIRAALVDKDRSPKWSPAATADVTEVSAAPCPSAHSDRDACPSLATPRRCIRQNSMIPSQFSWSPSAGASGAILQAAWRTRVEPADPPGVRARPEQDLRGVHEGEDVFSVEFESLTICKSPPRQNTDI